MESECMYKGQKMDGQMNPWAVEGRWMDDGWMLESGKCVYIMIARAISPAHSQFFENF